VFVASIHGTLFLESRASTLTLNSNITLFTLVCVHYISLSCWNNLLHHLARGLAICVDSIWVLLVVGNLEWVFLAWCWAWSVMTSSPSNYLYDSLSLSLSLSLSETWFSSCMSWVNFEHWTHCMLWWSFKLYHWPQRRILKGDNKLN